MHSFGSLNIYLFQATTFADLLITFILWLTLKDRKWLKVSSHMLTEMVTKYSPIFFKSFIDMQSNMNFNP